MSASDTIAAIATASGRSALGVVRVSGPAVPDIAARLLGFLPPPRYARLCRFLDAAGEPLDEGLAIYFPAPASYTGEPVLELSGHGGTRVLGLLHDRLLELGCRTARPGEFTERAFLNGKLDMAQAEAVADLIDAGSARAARAALRSLRGEFSERIAGLDADITALRVYVEAAIDFPDEEVDFLSDAELDRRLAAVFAAFDTVTAAARQGALLREGLAVAIAGLPNAGKSSLMNHLAGDEVAIVTEIAGTTRDVLRRDILVEGVPVSLADTAGLRETGDTIEAEGVRRARGELERADRILYVIDAAADEHARARELERARLPDAVPVSLVLNKIDLSGHTPRLDEVAQPARVWLSARTGEGVSLLREHLKSIVGAGHGGGAEAVGSEPDIGALGARRRHLEALARARGHLADAAEALRTLRAFELFAEDLRLAQRALGEITGEVSSEDLLGEIFGSFCIGK